MTHIHEDSIRLLLRCGWHEVCGLWCHEQHPGAYSVEEALKLCRGGGVKGE